MPDKLENRGGQDRTRINVKEGYELRDWSKKFGVTKDKLKEAVQPVGDQADKVEKYLKGNERSGTIDTGRGKSSSER